MAVQGDGARPTQLVGILLGQRACYAGEGGWVRVNLSRGAGARLRCATAASPSLAEDLPHLFDRFYRVDKARCGTRAATGWAGHRQGHLRGPRRQDQRQERPDRGHLLHRHPCPDMKRRGHDAALLWVGSVRQGGTGAAPPKDDVVALGGVALGQDGGLGDLAPGFHQPLDGAEDSPVEITSSTMATALAPDKQGVLPVQAEGLLSSGGDGHHLVGQGGGSGLDALAATM